MYITISDYKNGQPIDLLMAIKNKNDNYRVALSEILYYPKWYNISEELKNNTFLKNGVEQVIPDGYYNVHKLNSIFKKHNCKLSINEATGKLKIENFGDVVILNSLIAETLGFYSNANIIGKQEGTYLPKLINHKEMFIHLDCLNTSRNLFNDVKQSSYEGTTAKNSTLLRSIPVECEEINTGKKIEFRRLQYKDLIAGDIHNMRILIVDSNFKKLDMEYISLTLHFEPTSI